MAACPLIVLLNDADTFISALSNTTKRSFLPDVERALRRVAPRFGSSHTPASELLESQDVAVNLGVHSHFHEIGLGPYQYHLSFPPLAECFYVKALGLCNEAPARLVKPVCVFMSLDRRRAADFRSGTVTVEIALGCGAARFAQPRGLNPRSRLVPTASDGMSPTPARISDGKSRASLSCIRAVALATRR